jgi:hypothetical protein
MDGVYSMHEGDEKCIHKFSCKNLKRTEKFWEAGVDGRILLKRILKKQDVEFVDWIQFAQDMNQDGDL